MERPVKVKPLLIGLIVISEECFKSHGITYYLYILIYNTYSQVVHL